MFFLLFAKIGMLIGVSIIGWVIGRRGKVSPKDISMLLIYVISPFVIFSSILESPSSFGYLKYSVGAFIAAGLFALGAYLLASILWRSNKKNLFSFAGGTGNTGYFALPIVLSIFEPDQWAVAIFIIIGVNLYEFTLGYFITAKGMFNTRECLKKVLSLPIIYAAILALIFKYLNITLPEEVMSFMDNFKGAYSVLGMMVIGMTLASYRQLEIDWKFSSAAIAWKHLIVPISGMFLLSFMGLDDKTVLIIALMLSTPMAGNVVVVANQLDVHPQIAATTVMLSTLVSIISIPITLQLMQLL